MSAKRGDNLVIKRYDGASYVTVGSLRTKTLNLNGNRINVTTDDDVDANSEIWNTYITGPKDLIVEGEAIIKAASKTLVQAIYDDFATGTLTDYQVIVPKLGTFEVAMIVDSFSQNAAYDNVISFNLTLAAAAAPTFTAEP